MFCTNPSAEKHNVRHGRWHPNLSVNGLIGPKKNLTLKREALNLDTIKQKTKRRVVKTFQKSHFFKVRL
jgi:hypothetical protein